MCNSSFSLISTIVHDTPLSSVPVRVAVVTDLEIERLVASTHIFVLAVHRPRPATVPTPARRSGSILPATPGGACILGPLPPVTMKHTIEKEVISSRNHPAIKRIHNLQSRTERDSTGLFFVEGLRFVAQAVEHKATIRSIVYAPALLSTPFAQRLVRQQRYAGTRCLAVTPEVLHSLALNDDPRGIGAVVQQRWSSLEASQPTQGLCWVALETIQSPGNLGTIVRTCEAVGAAGLLLIGDNIDPHHPACVRASMGAMFTLDFARTTVEDFLRWKHRHGCTLVGTSPAAQAEYNAVDYESPLVLFMGWERKGLSPEQQRICDLMVRIPMVGHSDSLNLAVATGVMLYEVLRQRRVMEKASML